MFIHGGCMTMVDSLGLGNQLVDTECISFEKEEEKNSGGLTAAQRAILAHLVEQLDKKEGGHSMFEGLNDQSRKAIREAFGQGGFAWAWTSRSLSCLKCQLYVELCRSHSARELCFVRPQQVDKRSL